MTIQIEIPATNRQIDLIQNLDIEKQCTVKVTIVRLLSPDTRQEPPTRPEG